MLKKKALTILLLFLGCLLWCKGQTPARLLDSNEVYKIPDGVFFADSSAVMSVGEVVANRQLFRHSFHNYLSLGVTSEVVWSKVLVENLSADRNWVIDVSMPLFSSFSVYTYSASDTGNNQPVIDTLSIVQRRPHFLLPVTIVPGEKKILLFRAMTSNVMRVPLKISTMDALVKQSRVEFMLIGIIYGIMIAALGYQLVLYILLKERVYLFYCCYMVFVIWFHLLWSGHVFNITNVPLLNAPSAVMSLSLLASILFTNAFLRIRRMSPSLYFISKWLLMITLAPPVLVVLGMEHLAFRSFYVVMFLCYGYWFWAGILGVLDRQKLAWYFLTAFVILLGSGTVYSLMDLSVLPDNAFIESFLLTGMFANTILLSIGLSLRVGILKAEKEYHQKEVIAQADRFAIDTVETLELERTNIRAALKGKVISPLHAIKDQIGIIRAAYGLHDDEANHIAQTMVHTIDVVNREIIDTLDAAIAWGRKDDDLGKVIHQLTRDIASVVHLEIVTQIDIGKISLTNKESLNIYRIIQELLNNVIRHARATRCTVRLVLHAGLLHLLVEDNGQGFKASKKKQGMGLFGIIERVKKLKGNISMDAGEQGGVRIEIKIPYNG